MPDGYADGDVQLVVDALWEADWASPRRPSGSYDREARTVLRALASSGRLLPEGATVSPEFAVRWYLADQTFIEWGCDSLERARKAGREPLSEAVRGEIRRKDYWEGPWSVVEPVAVKEASDGD